MIDYNALRKKFPNKDPEKRSRDKKIKAIAREYEMKKASLVGGAPVMKKGVVFYAVVIIGLLMIGSLVLSVAGKGGKARIDRAELQAHKSVDALAVALGRYRFHVGEYPSNVEGLAALASTEIVKRGWDGPYIRKLVDDPWGHAYVYVYNGEAENPSVYSKGADGIAGTTDDILPARELFEEPFRDTSWTKEWMPYRLRGYVLAPDKETKKVVESQVAGIVKAQEAAAKLERRIVPGSVKVTFESISTIGAKGSVVYDVGNETVEEARDVVWPGSSGLVHILVPWVAPEVSGASVEVVAATVGDEIELFLNGESKGRSREMRWCIPYEDGEIKAIAYRNGEYIGECVEKTAYSPTELVLLPEASSMADDEILFVKVSVADDYGTFFPRATGKVAISVDGPAEVIVPDPVLNDGVAAFAVHRLVGSGKPVVIKASMPSLRSARIVLPRSS